AVGSPESRRWRVSCSRAASRAGRHAAHLPVVRGPLSATQSFECRVLSVELRSYQEIGDWRLEIALSPCPLVSLSPCRWSLVVGRWSGRHRPPAAYRPTLPRAPRRPPDARPRAAIA